MKLTSEKMNEQFDKIKCGDFLKNVKIACERVKIAMYPPFKYP